MMRLQLGGARQGGDGPGGAPPPQGAAAASGSGPVGARPPGRGVAVAGRASPQSASNDLMGNSLASYFSQLFEKAPPELSPGEKGLMRPGDKKKCKKCKKVSKAKDKNKVKVVSYCLQMNVFT